MSVLNWKKPNKVMSVESWKEISAEDAPAGVYTPNMSWDDKLKWKAKYIGGLSPRVEIRKTTDNGTQVLIVVSLGSFPRKSHYGEKEDSNIERGSIGKNVRISQNGPAMYTFDDISNMYIAIEEARRVLLSNGRGVVDE